MRWRSSLTMTPASRRPCGPLRPHRVRPPRLDALLDVATTPQFAVQNGPRQSRNLGFITAETKRNQLAAAQLPDPGAQIVRKTALQPQRLLQPDQAILNRQRHYPRGKGDAEQRHGND